MNSFKNVPFLSAEEKGSLTDVWVALFKDALQGFTHRNKLINFPVKFRVLLMTLLSLLGENQHIIYVADDDSAANSSLTTATVSVLSGDDPLHAVYMSRSPLQKDHYYADQLPYDSLVLVWDDGKFDKRLHQAIAEEKLGYRVLSAFRRKYVTQPYLENNYNQYDNYYYFYSAPFPFDPISHGLIPRRRAVTLNKQVYNAKPLHEYIVSGGKREVPHSRRQLTGYEVANIKRKAQT
jgi:hypothetical protein